MNTECGDNETSCQKNIKRIAEACDKVSLRKTDIASRRNYLKDIHKFISSSNEDFYNKEESKNTLDNIFQSLSFSLSDDSEKCRELAATALKEACLRFPISETYITSILTVLALRLKKTDERENSEEVRLIEIDILHQIIDKYEEDLMKHLSNVSSILSSCIVDECPDMKRKACECLSLLSSKTPHFHMVGGTFLKPLLSILSHQHLKTRSLCVKALGCIADYLTGEEFQEATGHLAQRLFDRSPVVRSEVVSVVGAMLVALKDRYSYFPRLIPLLLSALYDDVEEIRSKAQVLWNQAGEQYLSENEQQYKDFIDFPMPDPVDYPEPGSRPHLGCRILVQRHLCTILPALVHDVTDWVPETRAKSAQVLSSLVMHAEEKIVIQLPKALDGVISGAKDDNKDVMEYSLKSAELLGYFVPPPLLFDTVLTLTHGNPTWVHLSVLAATLKGSSGPLPAECFSAISQFLSAPTVARFREAKEQANLLLCVAGLLSKGNEIDSSLSYCFFTILISVSGLTTNDSVLMRSKELMEELAEVQCCSEVTLFQQHSLTFAKTLTENNELWTCHSPETPIFHFLVKSGPLDQSMAPLVFPVFTNNLFPGKEAKLRSQMLSLLIPVFDRLSPQHFRQMSTEILELVRSGIFPNLTWAAGKTACSLRTMAAACLFEILKRTSIKKEMLKSLESELLPTLSTLLEDEDAKTRLVSCKILEIILPELVGSVDDLKIHRACYDLLSGMDDSSEDVRLMTTQVLKTYMKSFPDNYDWKMYRSYLKHMFELVLVHMDDGNKKIQLAVFELLKEASFAAPDILLEEIESKKYMMSSGDLCDSLTEHIRQIKI